MKKNSNKGEYEMSSVEVKVNVINQLKLLRQSTFKDKLSFLDEDIQNAQRAKATEVKVSIDYSGRSVTIENNGKVLENPQALFSIAESEWDEDVQQTENPFGMGFFSNITVSDYIEVFTGNKHIVFNVSEMIQNNKTEIEVNEIVEYYQGFKLVLNNFDFDQVYLGSIRERVELLGRYIHELDIYCDDVLQTKKDLVEGDGSVFLKEVVQKDLYTGWVALNKGFSADVKIFYKGRVVTKIDILYYVKGDIHITDKALNLTSPDRKDIIRDEKYHKFIELIKKDIEKLANDSFMNGSQKSIEQHIDAISYHANKSELKNQMTFLVFDTENEEDSKYLNGIAIAKKDNSNVRTLNDYEVHLKQQSSKQNESNFTEVEINSDVKQLAPKARGIVTYDSDYSAGSVIEPKIDEKKTEERDGQQINFSEEPVFWLGFDEAIEYEGKFNIAKHYKLKVIVSRNKFESGVLELLGMEQNIIHIRELTEKNAIRAEMSNTVLSLKEQRALMLLDMISRIVGFSHNVFAIGDLMVVKKTEIEALNKTVERIEDNYIAIYDSHNKKIYVDRSTIDKRKLREDLNVNIDLEDFKFIILNLKQIVGQLTLTELKTKNQSDLYDSIINTLAVS